MTFASYKTFYNIKMSSVARMSKALEMLSHYAYCTFSIVKKFLFHAYNNRYRILSNTEQSCQIAFSDPFRKL